MKYYIVLIAIVLLQLASLGNATQVYMMYNSRSVTHNALGNAMTLIALLFVTQFVNLLNVTPLVQSLKTLSVM